MTEQTKSSKNKKALLEELKGNTQSGESKRSRGPMHLKEGSLIGTEQKVKETDQEVVVDFIYKVDHEKCEVSFYEKVEGDKSDLIWDFGNGQTFEGASPEKVSYDEPGRYTATLTDRISGMAKEKTFAIKHDSDSKESAEDKLKVDKIKSNYTGGLESFIENARREEFDFGVNNVRLSKNIHGVLSKICVNKVTITSLTNYIISNFIEENRNEIKKYIEKNNQFDF